MKVDVERCYPVLWGCHLDWRICRCVRWWCDFGEANRVFNKSGFRLSSFILGGSRGELLLCRGRDVLAGRVFRLFSGRGRAGERGELFVLKGFCFEAKYHLIIVEVLQQLFDCRGVRFHQGLIVLGQICTEGLDAGFVHLEEASTLLPSVLGVGA